jgi:hypothetical protein
VSVGQPIIREVHRQRLATLVGDRPIPAAVRAYQAMGVGVHEHQARIELVEPQPAR